MQTLLARCLVTLQEKITQAGAQVRVDGLLPLVNGDAAQLQQLLHAVLDNALTYQPRGNTPIVTIRPEDGGCFAVEDNGIGIPEAQHERVFGVFKRLHTDEEYPGVGMGLAIARKIVERHGGTIMFTPAPGGGTVCRFTLPFL